MKRIFRISLCAFLLLAGAACTRHKIIPDEKLAQIFHDAFLTNAYIGDVRVNIDSLNIYEPIFARYGYTTRDVYYTIGNFSKRKSARLGDVVEMAIDKLEAEGKFYDREVAVLDTIDNVARRTFTRTVYADSLIRVGSLRDTARLRIAVDVQPGAFAIEDFENFGSEAGKIAFSINGCKTVKEGKLTLADGAFPVIDAGKNLRIAYTAKVAAAEKVEKVNAATLIFTIAPATGNS
mgnify:CR=1 FL=1